jgi:hypothetical protein
LGTVLLRFAVPLLRAGDGYEFATCEIDDSGEFICKLALAGGVSFEGNFLDFVTEDLSDAAEPNTYVKTSCN